MRSAGRTPVVATFGMALAANLLAEFVPLFGTDVGLAENAA